MGTSESINQAIMVLGHKQRSRILSAFDGATKRYAESSQAGLEMWSTAVTIGLDNCFRFLTAASPSDALSVILEVVELGAGSVLAVADELVISLSESNHECGQTSTRVLQILMGSRSAACH